MLETMHDANGVGLAAVQVGKLRRLVIVEVEEGRPFILINPEIVAKEGRQTEAEGCLSIPGKWGITDRPMKVTVRATGLDGKNFSVIGSGLLARALCHEIDHLDGKLFTDNAVHVLTPEEMRELERE